MDESPTAWAIRAVKAQALRDAAEQFNEFNIGLNNTVKQWLKQRADEIEKG